MPFCVVALSHHAVLQKVLVEAEALRAGRKATRFYYCGVAVIGLPPKPGERWSVWLHPPNFYHDATEKMGGEDARFRRKYQNILAS